MQKLIALILQTVLGLQWLEGYRTYLAAAGLVGLALYQLATGDVPAAVQSFLAGLAALGIRGAVARTEQIATEAKLASMAAAADARPANHRPFYPAVLVALLLFAGSATAQPKPVCVNGRCPTATPVASGSLPLVSSATGNCVCTPAANCGSLGCPAVSGAAGPCPCQVLAAPRAMPATVAVIRPCQPGEFVTMTPWGPATCTPVASAETVAVERKGSRLCERVRAGVAKQLVKDGATKAEAEAKVSHLTDSFILEAARTKRIELPPDNLVGGWLDDHPGILALIKLLIQLLPLFL